MESMSYDNMDMLLPPHWKAEQRMSGEIVYFNELTREESTEHPYQRFLQRFAGAGSSKPTSKAPTPYVQEKGWDSYATRGEHIPEGDEMAGEEGDQHWYVPPGDQPRPSSSHDINTLHDRRQTLNSEERRRATFDSQIDEKRGQSPTLNETFGMRTNANFPDFFENAINYDYHCQWNERDVFGNVSLFGLTIRYLENGTTMIRFDGIEGEWTYSALKGPYGCLEMHDLFVGAKINLFGRHLTISACNSAASKWIDKERKRLEKQQEEFRRKIESIGATPVVKKREAQTIRHITRDAKTVAQANLRLLLKENARLGEQVASLGLAMRL